MRQYEAADPELHVWFNKTKKIQTQREETDFSPAYFSLFYPVSPFQSHFFPVRKFTVLMQFSIIMDLQGILVLNVSGYVKMLLVTLRILKSFDCV